MRFSTHCLHDPSPPPSGRERQEQCANLQQLHRPKFTVPSIDAHCTLGSPPGRAGAKRLRGLTAPIPPKNYPQNHRTDSTYKLPTEPPRRVHSMTTQGTDALIHPTNCIPPPSVCTAPLPLPSGGTSPHGARQGLCANF